VAKFSNSKFHLLHSLSSQSVAPSVVPPTSWIIYSITKVTKQRTQELKERDLPQGHFNEASKYLRGANQPSQQVLGPCNTHQESINTLLKLVDSRMIIKTSWNWLMLLFLITPLLQLCTPIVAWPWWCHINEKVSELPHVDKKKEPWISSSPSSSSHNDVGPTVSVHNVTQLTNIKPKCGLLKCLLHLATAEPACSIPTQHMSIGRWWPKERYVLDWICLDLKELQVHLSSTVALFLPEQCHILP
jgi:hypothetical protein